MIIIYINHIIYYNNVFSHLNLLYNSSLLEHWCDSVKLFINCHIRKSLLSGFTTDARLTGKCMYVMFQRLLAELF